MSAASTASTGISSRPGSGSAAVRVAAPAGPQRDVAAAPAGGPHSAGGVGPNSTTDGVPSAVARWAIPVSPHDDARGRGDGRGELEQVRAAGEHRGVRQPGGGRDRAGEPALVRRCR